MRKYEKKLKDLNLNTFHFFNYKHKLTKCQKYQFNFTDVHLVFNMRIFNSLFSISIGSTNKFSLFILFFLQINCIIQGKISNYPVFLAKKS